MLHVTLLGEQAFGDESGSRSVRSSRTLTLAAFLVIHANVPQSRHRLAPLFWPDSSDEQSLTNLRRELHYLRSALDDDPSLLVTAKELCWRDTPTCRVDVRVFLDEHAKAMRAAVRGDDDQALSHALAATAEYRGEFLPGSYEDWALETRAGLEQQCVELLELVCELRVRAEDLAGAVDAARRRVQLRPLDEIGYRRLMQLQGDLGDRAGAVGTYHRCASVLERELGVEPDPLTRESLNTLLARVGPAVTALPERDDVARRSGAANVTLVGRGAEFDSVHEAWHAASAGRASVAIVRGAAGVGKTRLVTDVAEAARRSGAVVATSQCFGTSGRLALSPVADWLRAPEVQSAMAELDTVWRAEVERLVPSGHGRREAAASPRAMVDAWQRHRFFEGLARALESVRRPMLLVLDNLHWCDPETLAFLTFCLQLTPDAPLLVAATLREDAAQDDPEVAEWIVRMKAAGLVSELTLHPLGVAGTVALAEGIAGRALSETEAELLHATTGGFPLFIVEAARSSDGLGADAFPSSDLTGVLRRRLEQASESAREISGLAAAVGRNFTLDLLTEASDLDADQVVRAVDELWRRRILQEVDQGYDFSHDLLRESAYTTVSPPRRWLLHRRIAQGLELLHADDVDPVSAQLAEQYARGGRADRALTYYRRAADIAAGLYAYAEAIRLYGEAIALIRAMPAGRGRDIRELEILESTAAPLNARYGYASVQLRSSQQRSFELAQGLGRRESALNTLIGLWASLFVSGETAAAHQAATEAQELLTSETELAAAAHFVFGGSALSLGRLTEALEHFTTCATSGSAHSLNIGTRPDLHGMAWAAHAHWLLGDDAQALARCTQAITLARGAGSPYNVAVVLAYAAVTYQLRNDLDALRDVVVELRELCRRYSFAYYREWGLVLDGWARGGETGLRLAQRGVDALTAEGSFARMPYWLSLLADVSARVGRPDDACTLLEAALATGRAHDDLWWLPEVMRMRAAYDEPEAAAARLRAAVRLAQQHGSIALLRRCEQDLAVRGVPSSRSAFLDTESAAGKAGNGSRTLRS